jgi:hypothetical protein
MYRETLGYLGSKERLCEVCLQFSTLLCRHVHSSCSQTMLKSSRQWEFREITVAWNWNLSHCGYLLVCAVLVLRFSVYGFP